MRAIIDDSWRQLPRLAEHATPAEQFSIWAMRLWWGVFPELDTAWPHLVRGFRQCNAAASTLEAFHRFCSIALPATARGAGIACPYCPRITPLEEKLLEGLAAATGIEFTVAEATLRQVMSASAARIAAPHAARFARGMAQAGLPWPRVNGTEAAHSAALDPSGNKSSQRLH
jgi:hypothetical protein